MNLITEDELEQIALDTLVDDLGYERLYGPDMVDCDTPERTHSEVVLSRRLQEAIDRINPNIPAEVREEAYKKVMRAASVDAVASNEAFHVMLTDGIDVKFRTASGTRSDKVWLIDYTPGSTNNEFVAINQFTVIENHTNKRPDVVIFVNGLPLVIIELKNATDENADIYAAYQQLQTYKSTIPSLFQYNCFMIASDGWFAKAGTISSDYSRFMEWKSADGEHIVDTSVEPEMEPMLKGMLAKENLLDIIRYFIVFEKGKDKTIKKIAAYHQYYAVNKAVKATVRASRPSSQASPSTPTLLPGGEGSHFRGGFNYSGLVVQARELRQKQTPAEELFWQLVRNRKFLNLKFRRQHQVGLYIVDFYCDECKLVIELDGSVHNISANKKNDEERDWNLAKQGFKVLRFTNGQIFGDI